MYLYRQMLHLQVALVALNSWEEVVDIPTAVLFIISHNILSLCLLGHPHVPAQVDVAVASGPEPKGESGRDVLGMPVAYLHHIQVRSEHIQQVF